MAHEVPAFTLMWSVLNYVGSCKLHTLVVEPSGVFWRTPHQTVCVDWFRQTAKTSSSPRAHNSGTLSKKISPFQSCGLKQTHSVACRPASYATSCSSAIFLARTKQAEPFSLLRPAAGAAVVQTRPFRRYCRFVF